MMMPNALFSSIRWYSLLYTDKHNVHIIPNECVPPGTKKEGVGEGWGVPIRTTEKNPSTLSTMCW